MLQGAARLVSTGARHWSLAVAHVDHQLRPDSGADAARVAAMASTLGLRCTVHRTDVAATARAEHRSREDAGRLVRYRFLEELATSLGPAALIATAHTADDEAETMLLRMARGSGLRGLRGIPARRGRIVRPLLDARRRDLRDALDEAGVAYLLDPTNDDTSAAARNLVRAEILPVLERLNPRAVVALQRLARLAADDDDALDAVAASELTRRRTGGSIDWREPPVRAIGRRVLRVAAGEPSPSAERVEALLDAAEGPRGGVTIELGGGRRASVRERRITLDQVK
jgi:tRNA(Ile)-lysidine synthase